MLGLRPLIRLGTVAAGLAATTLGAQALLAPAAAFMPVSQVVAAGTATVDSSATPVNIAAPVDPAPAAAAPAAQLPAAPASAPAAPPAATAPDPVPATATAAQPSSGSSPAPTGKRCDDSAWKGPDGINVEGRPDGLDAGDRGAVYVWHAADGWHLRATDVKATDHHYTGTIALSPHAVFTSFRTVRLEQEDSIRVTGDNVLHYSFNTHNGIDGIDFRVSACDGNRDTERMTFNLAYNGNDEDPGRVMLGDKKQHPKTGHFAVTRDVDKIDR